MSRDVERVTRISDVLRESGIDALVCALPINVLLVTGYWPVVGTSIAIITSEPRIVVVVPEDEFGLACGSGADEVKTFGTKLGSVVDAIQEVMRSVVRDLHLNAARIGYEYGTVSQPVSYAAMNLYGSSLIDLLKELCSSAAFIAADNILTRLRSVKTAIELSRIRTACSVAAQAFTEAAKILRSELSETEIASLLRIRLTTSESGVQRSGGFTYCMSGPNAAEAYAAYQLSRARRVHPGDVALIHCNSYVDGYWTDITRTFCVSEMNQQKRVRFDAVLAAREAAIDAIVSGVKCADVDRAARDVLKSRGYDREFKHGLGHGVGFEAIDHNAPPRLHPDSPDVLQTGMVFNVEPAIYIEGEFGLRHCDMISVTQNGREVLTPFQLTVDELVTDL